MLRVSPAHEHNAWAERNRATSPISATRIGGDGRANPVDAVDGLVAPVAPQLAVDLALEHAHLPVVQLDQVP
jgi:hypothetical protein